MAERFQVCMLDGARQDFLELDGSVRPLVQKQILKLKENADILGKELGNYHNVKLAGCRELKLREAGIRIVYQITDLKVEVLEIVLIVAIEKRHDFRVFKIADRRLNQWKALPAKEVQATITKALDDFYQFGFDRRKEKKDQP
jgi:mRNA interferase RelE/StbE